VRGLRRLLVAALLASLWYSSAQSEWGPGRNVNDPRTVAQLQADADAGEAVRVLVELALPITPDGLLSPAARGAQRAAIAAAQAVVLGAVSGLNADAGHAFETIPFLALRLDGPALRALRANPQVAGIQEDQLWDLTLKESVPLVGAPVTLNSGSAYTGDGYSVAILDTGVTRAHPFLSGKVVAEACYSNGGIASLSSSLCPGGAGSSTAVGSGEDCSGISGCGHGTHVAGIAAGLRHDTQANGPFDGVARGAEIIAVQVFTNVSGEARAYTSDIIKGLEFVYGLRNTRSIAAANLSLGGGSLQSSACDAGNSAFKTVVDNLRSARIATVAAAGNDGSTAGITWPACISSVISVGSTTKGDVVSSFSNSAPILDLWAPGSSIRSSIPSAGYASYNGTSMAAPHVAGAWAIMRQAYPGESVTQLLARLQQAGKPVTDTRSGAGNLVRPRLDLRTAVEPPIAAIELSVTLSEGGTCGNEPLLRVATGTAVTACFTITNRGSVTLSQHTLTANVLNAPATSAQSVPPSGSLTLPFPLTATATTAITASWVSSDGTESASASAVGNLVVYPVDYLRTPNRPIDDPPGSGVNLQDDLVIAHTGTLANLEVYLQASHTWVGDLEARLTHVESNTSVDLFGNLLGWDYCSGQNVDSFFHSSATRNPYTLCSSDAGLVAGPYQADGDLSAFAELQGTWRLTLVDTYPTVDGGTWIAWGLRIALAEDDPPPPPTPSASLVPSATTCVEAPLGNDCTATLTLSDHTGTSFAMQVDFTAPGFSVEGASAGSLLSLCQVSAGPTRIGVVCQDGFTGDGEALIVHLQREVGATSSFTTSAGFLVRANDAEEPLTGGSLAVPYLSCAIGFFADYPFGDVNGSRTINVTDALMVLQMAVGNLVPEAFAAYHADQNSSGSINVTDALIVLRKAVDPERPAQIEAYPLTIELAPGESGCVLIGNSGTLTLPALNVLAPDGVIVSNITRSEAVGFVFHIYYASGSGGTIIFDAGEAGSQGVVVTPR
jgi:subtilisin family serine protease